MATGTRTRSCDICLSAAYGLRSNVPEGCPRVEAAVYDLGRHMHFTGETAQVRYLCERHGQRMAAKHRQRYRISPTAPEPAAG
jgi:hypothetical protein